MEEFKIEKYKNVPKGNNQLNIEFIQDKKIILLENGKDNIVLAGTEFPDTNLSLQIESVFQKKFNFIKITENQFYKILNKNNIFNDEKKSDFHKNKKENNINNFENEAPVVNFVNTLFIEAINENVSDIHLESNDYEANIRFRKNGIMLQYKKLTTDFFDSISARIKIMAELNILEKRHPQDGKIDITVKDEKINIRVSIIPSSKGESIVLRILNRKIKDTSLESLGFSSRQIKTLNKMISLPYGLILISGPTGSGKTTTLTSILKQLSDGSRKIITVEDPVEYTIENTSQIQVNEDIGLTFENILRRVLRQDPDIIMVGEIRDKATAQLCIRAALTGHLVLSTVHSNDAIGIIDRLKNFEIEDYMIAAVLKGIISQRLIRTERNKSNGRILISESFLIESEEQNFISNHYDSRKMKTLLKKKKNDFIEEDALNKIKAKLITKNDVLKEIKMEA